MVSVINLHKNILKNKTIFKDQLKHECNQKLILKSTILTILIMVCFLIMGLIFAQQNIFLISALLGLFGKHIVAYNITNLLLFIVSGGAIGLLISYISARYVNQQAREYSELLPPEYLSDKTFESLVIPLVFSIRDLCSKDPIFTNIYTEGYKKRIYTFITQKFGYDEESSKELIEMYFQIDINDLEKKLNSLDFKVVISQGKETAKRDLSFLRKNFKNYYRDITNVNNKPSLLYSRHIKDLIDKEEKEVIKLLSNSRKDKN